MELLEIKPDLQPQLVREPVQPVLQDARDEVAVPLRVSITEARIKKMKAGIMRTIAEDPQSQFRFVAHYMTHESGEYMTADEAFEILDELSIVDIGDIINKMMAKVQGVAASKK